MAKASTTKGATKPAAAKKPVAKSGEPNMQDGIFVRSMPETFRRAGFTFTREGVGLALTALTQEQLKAIEEEPLLNVQYMEFPVTAEDDQVLGKQAEDSAKDLASTEPVVTPPVNPVQDENA